MVGGGGGGVEEQFQSGLVAAFFFAAHEEKATRTSKITGKTKNSFRFTVKRELFLVFITVFYFG